MNISTKKLPIAHSEEVEAETHVPHVPSPAQADRAVVDRVKNWPEFVLAIQINFKIYKSYKSVFRNCEILKNIFSEE